MTTDFTDFRKIDTDLEEGINHEGTKRIVDEFMGECINE